MLYLQTSGFLRGCAYRILWDYFLIFLMNNNNNKKVPGEYSVLNENMAGLLTWSQMRGLKTKPDWQSMLFKTLSGWPELWLYFLCSVIVFLSPTCGMITGTSTLHRKGCREVGSLKPRPPVSPLALRCLLASAPLNPIRGLGHSRRLQELPSA